MNYLLKEDYVPYAPTSDGDQIYISHTHCPAVHGGGADTKRRLGIRRTNNGNTILAYCHHCGQSGSHVENRSTLFSPKKRDGDIVHQSTGPTRDTKGSSRQARVLPSDYTRDIREWPAPLKVWLFKHGITLEEIRKYAIGYSDKCDGLVFPVHNGIHLEGYVVRKSKGPIKYDATRTNGGSFSINHGKYGTILCLCEDIVSTIKVGRYVSARALLGVHVNDKVLTECAKYDKVYIFLDDDNRQVKLAMRKIQRKIELVCHSVVLVQKGKDPKACTDEELKEVFYGRI